MPRKRGPRRRTSPIRRITRFKKGYTHHVVPLLYKKTLPEATAQVSYWLLEQDQLEKSVLSTLESHGVPQDQRDHYLAYARRKRKVGDHFTAKTRESEFQALHSEFVLRGLDSDVLDAVQAAMYPAAVWILGYSRLGIDTRLG